MGRKGREGKNGIGKVSKGYLDRRFRYERFMIAWDACLIDYQLPTYLQLCIGGKSTTTVKDALWIGIPFALALVIFYLLYPHFYWLG